MPDPKDNLVLVTGAGGAVGGLLVEKLLENGCRVRGSVTETFGGTFPDNVETAVGDLRDEAFVRDLVAGASCIFHFAAKLHVNDPSPGLEREYRPVNVDATRTLLDRSACERFIFASSINVYGTGGPFDETSELHPEGVYAETKMEAENLVLEHPGGTVLRFAAIYGKHMKGNFPRLVRAIRRGRFAYVGSGENRRTLVHEDDAVCAAMLAAADERSRQRIFNVTDGEVHTLKEIVEAISKAVGRQPPRIHLPETLARAGFAVGDLFLKVAGQGVRLTPLIDKINEDIAVSGIRIRDELGFEPEFGLEKGWKDAVGESSGVSSK